MTENNTPKVFAAIHKVLKALQVEKNGDLPSNMGSGKYATAEAVSNGVKNLFVEHKLILEANEDIVKLEYPDYGDKKMRVMATVKGTYRAIHVEDGSSISFSGHGNGIATGVAIALNTSSTFALKNALQRQFLISEDSVEREGHTEQAAPKQNSAQQAAAKATTAPATIKKAPAGANAAAQKRVKDKMDDGTYDRDRVTALNAKIAEKLGKPKGDVLVELEKALEAGEVA